MNKDLQASKAYLCTILFNSTTIINYFLLSTTTREHPRYDYPLSKSFLTLSQPQKLLLGICLTNQDLPYSKAVTSVSFGCT